MGAGGCPRHPGNLHPPRWPRAPSVASFTFDGKRVPFEAGDTFAAAMHRAGIRVLSRSLRYHRPRGLYCNLGSCASCFVDVDGTPNVPACMAAARDGCTLRSQNRLGTAKHDLLGVVDKVYRQGFDPHDAFTRPKLLNDAFLVGVRLMSGLGRPPAAGTLPATPQRHLAAADELVVGAGAQGLAAAERALRAGRSVILVDELERLGGTAAWDPLEAATRKRAGEATAWPGAQVWTGSLCFGLYPGPQGPLAAIARPGPAGLDLWEVTASRITVAAGAHDGHPAFTNNDLPGVMALRGAVRLLGEHGVRPGERAVVHGAPLPHTTRAVLENAGCLVVAQGEVEAARGGSAVEAARVGGDWVACDTILCNLPSAPRVELYQQAGCELTWRDGRLVPKAGPDGATTVPGVHAALPEATTLQAVA
jgi:sarcosine oxidase, subunit alpha